MPYTSLVGGKMPGARVSFRSANANANPPTKVGRLTISIRAWLTKAYFPQRVAALVHSVRKAAPIPINAHLSDFSLSELARIGYCPL